MDAQSDTEKLFSEKFETFWAKLRADSLADFNSRHKFWLARLFLKPGWLERENNEVIKAFSKISYNHGVNDGLLSALEKMKENDKST